MDNIVSISEKLKSIILDESTPPWAQILINCISELVTAVEESNISSERFNKMEAICEVRGQVIENLQHEIKTIKEELEITRQTADQNEQKSRSQCLLIHGVEEGETENTDNLCLDVIKNKVGVVIDLTDIERSHRIGPRKVNTRSTRPRAIILRFSSMRKRMEVFYNKKNLKNTSFTVTESLTRLRYELLQRAKEKFGYKEVWTSEGKIFTKINNKLTLISSVTDLT